MYRNGCYAEFEREPAARGVGALSVQRQFESPILRQVPDLGCAPGTSRGGMTHARGVKEPTWDPMQGSAPCHISPAVQSSC